MENEKFSNKVMQCMLENNGKYLFLSRNENNIKVMIDIDIDNLYSVNVIFNRIEASGIVNERNYYTVMPF